MASPKSLASMSLDALLKLRDDVTEILGVQATAMQEQLARMTGLGKTTTRRRQRKPAKRHRRKAAAQHRNNRRKKSSAKRARSRRTAAQSNARGKSGVSRATRLAKKSARKTTPAPAKTAKRARARRRAKPVTPSRARPEPKLDAAPAQASSVQTQAGQE